MTYIDSAKLKLMAMPSAFFPTKAAAAIRWKTVIGHRKLNGSLWAPEILNRIKRIHKVHWLKDNYALIAGVICLCQALINLSASLWIDCDSVPKNSLKRKPM